MCFVQPTPTTSSVYGDLSASDARVTNSLLLRQGIISALRLFSPTSLFGFMAEPENVAHDIHIVRFLMSVGLLNPVHHLTANEWASLVTIGLGPAPTRSTLDCSPMKKMNVLYAFSDSGLMPHGAQAATSMHPYTQTAAELPFWRNCVIKCRHGGDFLDFKKWMEAVLFAHGGGPEDWRADIPVAGSVPPKGSPEHNPEEWAQMRRNVWNAAMDVAELPEDMANMDSLLFVPPSEMAILIITCWNDVVDDKNGHKACRD